MSRAEEPVHAPVFVYGTLLRGSSNHGYLAGAVLAGAAETVERYHMHCFADGIPYVARRGPGQPSAVRGELYLVGPATLARLDLLEEHPHVYRREEVEVRMSTGERRRAWLYFMAQSGGAAVPGGDYRRCPRFLRS